MRTPSNDLFRLIKSMTPSEKRYFKQHFDISGGLKVQLFDVINKQSEYDEEAIKEHFEGTSVARSLKVHKVQLTRLIITSLISCRREKLSEKTSATLLQDAKVLLDQNLLGACLRKCDEAIKVGSEKDEFSRVLHAIELKNNALRQAGIHEIIDDPQVILKIRKDLNLKRLSINRNLQLYSEMYDLGLQIVTLLDYDNSSKRTQKFEKLLQACLSYDFTLSMENRALYIQYLGLLKTCYFGLDRPEKVQEVARLQIEYVREHFDDCPSNVKVSLLRSVCNYLYQMIQQSNHDEVDYWLAFEERAQKHQEVRQGLNRVIFFLPKLLCYRNRGMYDYVLRLYPAMQKYIKDKNCHADPMTEQVQLNFALITLVVQDLELLREVIERIKRYRMKLDSLFEGLVDAIELAYLYDDGQHATLKRRLKRLENKAQYGKYLGIWVGLMKQLLHTSLLKQKEILKESLDQFNAEAFQRHR